MNKSKHKIPILSPTLFRENHIMNSSDILLKGDNITDFFIHSFKGDFVNLNLPLPPHKKTVNDFVFVRNGSMAKSLGIDSFELQANDFLFTPKNSITTTENTSVDLDGYYFHFSDAFIGANPFLAKWQNNTITHNFLHLNENESINIEFLLNRILELHKTQNVEPNNFKLIRVYLSTLIAEVFLITEKKPTEKRPGNHISTSFKNLVHQHFKENLNVKDYAALLFITPNHLNKMVKSGTGKTASEIIKEVTILESKVLLIQTEMTIKEISNELGFSDISYFGRFFKNATKYSPRDYREMIDLS